LRFNFENYNLKTILITGASGGLGKEIALYFANKNWNVIATVIAINEAEVFQNVPNIYCYELNVTSQESIEKAKSAIVANHPTIDAIVNNAGIGYRSFVELSEDQKIDSIVDINWLGVVKMCRAFIPIFRKQGFGQFINITSIAGLVNLPLGSFYHSTKKAVESFSECMSYELMDFNISVCTVQFGNAPTNFQKNVVKCDKTDIQSYNSLMDNITDILNKKTSKNKNLTQDIVEKIYDIAEHPSKKFRRYTIGFDANFMHFLRKLLGYRLFNAVIRMKVFKN
jgi:short-subunit dehydrogenase